LRLLGGAAAKARDRAPGDREDLSGLLASKAKKGGNGKLPRETLGAAQWILEGEERGNGCAHWHCHKQPRAALIARRSPSPTFRQFQGPGGRFWCRKRVMVS
jgi:hypothetical protein